MPAKNPFNPGSGVPPPYLAGRERHIESFHSMLKGIEDGHVENLILSGLRGTGKTVLVEEFSKICVKNGFLPVKRLQFSKKYCDPAEFAGALECDIRASVERFSKLRSVKSRLSASLSHIKPKKVGIPEVFYYEPSYEPSKIPFEDHLKEYLSSNWSVFENSAYKGVILLFDEFHTVFDVPSRRWFALSDFLGALNDVQREGCRYFAVFSGLPSLHLNIKKARSYSERMYKTVNVGNLGEDETRLAITNPLRRSRFGFEGRLVDRVTDDTGRYPYFIQFYCKEIINGAGKRQISLKDYDLIRPAIIRQLDTDFFGPRMEMLSRDEERAILSMAESADSDITFEFIRKRTAIPRTSISKYLTRLEEKGLIYNYKRGVYRFSIPMLREHLARRSA